MKRNLFSTFAIILGLVSTSLFLNFNPDKEYAFAPKPHTDQRAPANYNKIKAPIEVSISRIDDASSNQIHLVGSVFARRDFTNLKEDWGIPQGVQVVSGSVELNFDIKNGETKQFDILLSQDNPGDHLVTFEAATTDQPAGQNLGAVTNINTRGPELLDRVVEVNSMSSPQKIRAAHLRKIVF